MQRSARSREQLERDAPSLAGRLDPPRGARPPAGVEVERRGNGTRVVTINIHQAVPSWQELGPDNQRIEALRDVAAYVNSVDPDVVAVQEVRHVAADERRDAVPSQASLLYHLLDADDMAFAPATAGDHADTYGDSTRYGNAIYTRNGHTISQAHNIDLPNREGDIENRAAGLAVVERPGGGRFTMVSAHLSVTEGDESEGELRARQLERLASQLRDARDGTMDYMDPITEETVTARGLPVDGEVIVAGDMNARHDRNAGEASPDDVLTGQLGLLHAMQGVEADDDQRERWAESIDQIYASVGFGSAGYHVSTVPLTELDPPDDESDDPPSPTDHPMVVADFVPRSTGGSPR